MNYYERHIGDYLKDTAHLSLLEHGVYTRLMDVYYTREGGIPEGDATRLIGARSREERAALSAVLAEFFVLIDGVQRQHRCDREIARFQDKQSKAKRSADARWNAQRTQSEGNANASPDAMRTQSEGNANASPDAMRTHSEGNADGMHRAPVPSHQTPVTKPKTQNPEAARIGINTIGAETGAAVARSEIPPPDPSKSPTRRGAVAVILRQNGVADATQAHPLVVEWAQQGVTDQQIRDAIEIARTRKPSGDIPVQYLRPIVTELHERPVDAGGSKERDWDRIFGRQEHTA